MKDVEADAGLALDGHKIILNAVGIHELGHIGAHMTTKQAGCHDIVAQLAQTRATLRPLPPAVFSGVTRLTSSIMSSSS